MDVSICLLRILILSSLALNSYDILNKNITDVFLPSGMRFFLKKIRFLSKMELDVSKLGIPSLITEVAGKR